jgi:hypothetical protein
MFAIQCGKIDTNRQRHDLTDREFWSRHSTHSKHRPELVVKAYIYSSCSLI